MRCYFMKGGHIVSVHVFDPLPSSDDDAIKTSLALFRERAGRCETFEVWDRTRMVYQHTVETGTNSQGPKEA